MFNVTTFHVDQKVRKCASEQGNNVLLSKLSGGDMIALDAKYHAKCLAGLYNKSRCSEMQTTSSGVHVCEGVVFAELVNFIEKSLKDSNETHPVFKMSVLTKMYKMRLMQLLGVDEQHMPDVHTSRLRQRILAYFPYMTASMSGREYFLAYDKAAGEAMLQACKDDQDEDALALLRVAKMVRKEMLQHKNTFNGDLDYESQHKSVPRSLLAIVNMLLYGANIEANEVVTQPSLTISQLLCFNIQSRKPTGNILRHQTERETPLAVYMGLSIFGKTRKKEIVEKLHSLGLSISYTRVLELSTAMCEVVNVKFQEEKVLCPSKLREGIFTIGAYDNIDHNPSSSTSEGSFHGTSISIFQNPTPDCLGTVRPTQDMQYNISTLNKRSVPSLPEEFAVVKPAFLPSKEPNIAVCSDATSKLMLSTTTMDDKKEEIAWLKHVISNDTNIGLDASWAAYHASSKKTPTDFIPGISTLLPLFYEDSSSIAMIQHAMSIIKQVTQFLNGNQIPVMALDQPLFALAKLIQWNNPDIYGEKKFVVMFGAFHIEQAFLRVLGQWMSGSGWSGAIAQADIATSSAAESYLKVIHVKKARGIHQVTAAALYHLLHDAYQEADSELEFQTWCEERAEESVMFKYWQTCLNMEILLLLFVRSIREGNYILFRECLKEMMPWFFLLDHHHYARWLSIHLKDLYDAEIELPDIHRSFISGQFVIRKSNRIFSAISVDQAHEQNNAVVKGDGGAVGLTQDPSALRRWMVSGPEISRLIQEFESGIQLKPEENNRLHHEQYHSFQVKYVAKVRALYSTLKELGNPFLENDEDLIVIDSRIIVHKQVNATVYSAESTGVELFHNFIEERLVKKSSTIFQTLKKNNVPLFSTPEMSFSKKNNTLKILKADVQLFSRLFIVTQNRQLDMKNFFKHENQPYPPALSSNGKFRLGNKADLAHILEDTVNTNDHAFPGTCDAVVYDGAVLTNILKPQTSKTFADYYMNTFHPHICKDIEAFGCQRIDFIWDRYVTPSIKGQTREKRGAGTRRQVLSHVIVPKNWQGFLRNSNNKEELFSLLGTLAINTITNVQVVTTSGEDVKGNINAQTSLIGVTCPGHEEADSRIILHLQDMVENGFRNISIRTVDTDVLVLAIAYFFTLSTAGLDKLWIAFGTGKNYRFIPVHAIAEAIGREKAIALPGFHAFTGCDSIPSFTGKSKKSTWKTWMLFKEATTAFSFISQPQNSIPTEILDIIERYVVLLYCSTSDNVSVNDARQELFMTKNRPLESLPPTKGALQQQVLRSAFQAGHIWGQANKRAICVPSPNDWGWWLHDESWQLKWSELPEISDSCNELIKCMCKICKNKCSCRNAGLSCTLLCKCKNECEK